MNGETRRVIVSGRGHGKRAAQAEWLKQHGDPSIKPGDVVLLTVGDMTGIPAKPAPGHWMKRLFLGRK